MDLLTCPTIEYTYANNPFDADLEWFHFSKVDF